METKLNIVEILKDKPKGTKLYSPLFGNVYFSDINNSTTYVLHHTSMASFYSDATFIKFEEAEPLLFPSKEMRDWSKFAWKKGDVLVNNDGDKEIIFKDWFDDSYTKFYGEHYLNYEDENNIKYLKEVICCINRYSIEGNGASLCYIKTIEKRLGGKLNLETLEIEKTQPEFKDGDIVFVESHMLGINTSSMIAIFRKEKEIDKYKFSPALCESNEHDTYLREDSVVLSPSEIKIFRPATDSEKQQLFVALAKENKAWDAEKKEIVDLKPKYELKPFDKVVVRCSEADRWSIDFFSYKVSNGYICTGDAWFKYCLPYNEETAKLIGTTNNAK